MIWVRMIVGCTLLCAVPELDDVILCLWFETELTASVADVPASVSVEHLD